MNAIRYPDLTTDDLRVEDLRIGDLDAAGWGSSWQPDSRHRIPWSDLDDWPAPDDLETTPSTDWDRWPILDRHEHARPLLVGA